MKNTDTITYSKYDLLVMKAEAIRSVGENLTSYIDNYETEIESLEKELQTMEEENTTKNEWGGWNWQYESAHRNLEGAVQKLAIWKKLVDTLDKMM